jgi:hypothetical protein
MVNEEIKAEGVDEDEVKNETAVNVEEAARGDGHEVEQENEAEGEGFTGEPAEDKAEKKKTQP